MIFFVYWEFCFASEPIIDKRIFRTWTAISAYIQTMIHGLVLYASIYFLSETILLLHSLRKNNISVKKDNIKSLVFRNLS